jgi:DNA-binding MarR family transcriptional regulator
MADATIPDEGAKGDQAIGKRATGTPTPDDAGSPLVLETFLPYRLNRISELISQRFARIYRDRYGLTRPEWRALAALGQFERMTATAIGANSSMHKTKVSRAVVSLERRHWLTRETDASDRRIEHLTLTREGRRIYGELATIAHAYAADLRALCGTAGYAALDAGIATLEAAINLAGNARRPPSAEDASA